MAPLTETQERAVTDWWDGEPADVPVVERPPPGSRSINDAAKEWKCSRSEVRRLVHAGRVRAVAVMYGKMRLVFVVTKEKPAEDLRRKGRK